jgi:hypothetical protein
MPAHQDVFLKTMFSTSSDAPSDYGPGSTTLNNIDDK